LAAAGSTHKDKELAMRNKMYLPIFAMSLMIALAFSATAQMQSPNYRIPSAVLSGGGASMHATSYQTDASLGQPTPIPDPADPPFSDSYDLYPGFWHTVVNIGVTCLCDFNGDKDVDGSDLVEYLFDSGGLSLHVFATDFGKDNCP
jgi:hypothetical protein